MSEQRAPQTFGGLFAMAGTSIIRSPVGRVCAVVLIIAEIYRLGIGSLWQQTTEFRKNYALMQVADAEAAASVQKQRDEAQAIAEEAKLKKAEANAALLKAKADADAMEQEAITAEQTGLAAPALEKALADEITAKGNVLIGTATAARDQAKATAERTEAQAREAAANAATLMATVDAKIAQLKSAAMIQQQNAIEYIGSPVPAELQFESSK